MSLCQCYDLYALVIGKPWSSLVEGGEQLVGLIQPLSPSTKDLHG